MKDYIGKSITALLIAAALIVGVSGPVAAMDRTTMLTMFWGDSYTSTLEMSDTLEILDTLEMN